MSDIDIRGDGIRPFDGQNRVAIPATLRAELGEDLVVFAPPVTNDRYLVIYPVAEWKAYCERVYQSRSGVALAQAQRQISSNAYNTKSDKQGRVTIKDKFRNYANLPDDVYVVGVGNRIELWNLDAWDEKYGTLEKPKENLDDVSL